MFEMIGKITCLIIALVLTFYIVKAVFRATGYSICVLFDWIDMMRKKGYYSVPIKQNKLQKGLTKILPLLIPFVWTLEFLEDLKMNFSREFMSSTRCGRWKFNYQRGSISKQSNEIVEHNLKHMYPNNGEQ